jgi:Tfp pilus assembly protein FimT
MVMLLLAIMAAVAVPSFRGFSQGRRVGSCASQLVSLGHWARTQSITRGVAYRLNIDPATQSYWLTIDRNGLFENLGEEMGRTFKAPEGVTLQWYGPNPVASEFPNVEFLPTGRTNAAVTIQVSDTRGSVQEVACRMPGERIRVLADWERTTVR